MAFAGACADRGGHRGGAAAIARTSARAFGGRTRIRQNKCEIGAPRSKRSIARRRKKSQEWIKKTWDEKPISQARFFSEINKRVQGKAWALVSAHGRRWREVIEVSEPAHGMGGGRGGGVGYGLPSSIGSALGFKGSGRLCVSIFGDGDFLMTSNALWTAAKYQIPLLVIVLNNHSYYNDEEHQERMARARKRPVENKGIGIRIEDPAPDWSTIAARLASMLSVRSPNRVSSARPRQSDRDRRKRQAGGRRCGHAAAVNGGANASKKKTRNRKDSAKHVLSECEGTEPRKG